MIATNELRILVRSISMCDGPGNDLKRYTLQQLFVNEDRTQQEWRTVPQVEEKDA